VEARGFSQNAHIKTNRQPGVPGSGPVTEAGISVQGSGGSEQKTVT
jgi:hypothetical protein